MIGGVRGITNCPNAERMITRDNEAQEGTGFIIGHNKALSVCHQVRSRSNTPETESITITVSESVSHSQLTVVQVSARQFLLRRIEQVLVRCLCCNGVCWYTLRGVRKLL